MVDVSSGVLQGSLIGPVLFVICINDIPAKVKNVISPFAGDAKLYGKSTDPENQSSIQHDLAHLQKCSNVWQLKFNETKCKVPHLGNSISKLPCKMDSADNSVTLEESTQERDLGILVDNNLIFNDHIAHAIKKANQKLQQTTVCLFLSNFTQHMYNHYLSMEISSGPQF